MTSREKKCLKKWRAKKKKERDVWTAMMMTTTKKSQLFFCFQSVKKKNFFFLTNWLLYCTTVLRLNWNLEIEMNELANKCQRLLNDHYYIYTSNTRVWIKQGLIHVCIWNWLIKKIKKFFPFNRQTFYIIIIIWLYHTHTNNNEWIDGWNYIFFLSSSNERKKTVMNDSCNKNFFFYITFCLIDSMMRDW